MNPKPRIDKKPKRYMGRGFFIQSPNAHRAPKKIRATTPNLRMPWAFIGSEFTVSAVVACGNYGEVGSGLPFFRWPSHACCIPTRILIHRPLRLRRRDRRARRPLSLTEPTEDTELIPSLSPIFPLAPGAERKTHPCGKSLLSFRKSDLLVNSRNPRFKEAIGRLTIVPLRGTELLAWFFQPCPARPVGRDYRTGVKCLPCLPHR